MAAENKLVKERINQFLVISNDQNEKENVSPTIRKIRSHQIQNNVQKFISIFEGKSSKSPPRDENESDNW